MVLAIVSPPVTAHEKSLGHLRLPSISRRLVDVNPAEKLFNKPIFGSAPSVSGYDRAELETLTLTLCF